MATAEQLRAIRQKYHLGEFKHSSNNKHRARAKRRLSSIKYRKEVKIMAKKRRSGKRSGGLGLGNNLMGTAMGVGGYILYEAYLSPKIPIQQPMLNFVELAAGIWASRKGGIIGNVGKAAIILNVYQILQPLIANMSASNGSTSFFS